MKIIEKQLSTEVYTNLRKICGLSEKSLEAAEIGLANGMFAVTLRS